MNKFWEFYSSYFGEEITDPQQLTLHKFNGEELQEFCETWSKECFNAAREEINNLDFIDPTFGPSLKYKTYEDYLNSLEK